MEPTLHNEDKSMMFKTLKPKVGDVIFVNSGDIKVIKRLIAVEGDTVEIKNNQLLINDEIVKEEYIKEKMDTGDFPRRKLQKGELFVLGDNRNNSSDSRSYGFYNEEDYIGKALFYIRGFKFNKIENKLYNAMENEEITEESKK